MELGWKKQLNSLEAKLAPVSDAFEAGGFELYLVGGIVRDSALGSASPDVDLTTNAAPEHIRRILSPLVSALWDQGERFGTIGGKLDELDLEITTFRGESYTPDSRKPEVVFGDSIEVDLGRRDFTINAMALRLPGLTLVDPFGGMTDLTSRELKTPFDPVDSFSDDPLRVLRAARFAARLDLAIPDSVVDAAIATKDRLSVVSAERVNDELEKLLLVEDASLGIDFLVATQAWEEVFGWVWSDTQIVSVKAALKHLDQVLERRVALHHHAPDLKQSLMSLKPSNVTMSETVAVDSCLKSLLSHDPSEPLIRELCVDHSLPSLQAALRVGLALGHELINPHFEIFTALVNSGQLDQLEVPVTGSEIMQRYDLTEGKLVGDLLRLVQQQIIESGPLELSDIWNKLDAELSPR